MKLYAVERDRRVSALLNAGVSPPRHGRNSRTSSRGHDWTGAGSCHFPGICRHSSKTEQ